MTNEIHQKAFSLSLLSRERALDPSERSFLNGHLRNCKSCREQAGWHQLLSGALHYEPEAKALTKSQLNLVLPGIMKGVRSRQAMQKTMGFVFSFVKWGLAALLIVTLVWVLDQVRSVQQPAGSTGVIPGLSILTETPMPTSTPTPYPSATPTTEIIYPRVSVIQYTVQPGDTVYGIAEKFHLTPETILWRNSEALAEDHQALTPGMELNILPVDGVYYEWKEGDDLNEVASRFGVDPEVIIDWPGNHLNSVTLGDLSNPNIKPGYKLVIPGGQIGFAPWNPGTLTPEGIAATSVPFRSAFPPTVSP